eukprot:1085705-Amphidinium_carterae.1
MSVKFRNGLCMNWNRVAMLMESTLVICERDFHKVHAYRQHFRRTHATAADHIQHAELHHSQGPTRDNGQMEDSRSRGAKGNGVRKGKGAGKGGYKGWRPARSNYDFNACTQLLPTTISVPRPPFPPVRTSSTMQPSLLSFFITIVIFQCSLG